jgi:hypothetical protein
MERAIIAGFGSANHGEFSYQGRDPTQLRTPNATYLLLLSSVFFPVLGILYCFLSSFTVCGSSPAVIYLKFHCLYEVSILLIVVATSFYGPNVARPMSYGLCGEDPDG